jgi:hypothetical protein
MGLRKLKWIRRKPRRPAEPYSDFHKPMSFAECTSHGYPFLYPVGGYPPVHGYPLRAGGNGAGLRGLNGRPT